MRKLVAVMVMVGMMSVAGYASPFSKDAAGTATAQFLKLGAGARASAMGEAYAGVADDATAIYWNPAGLNGVTGRSASVMHAVWFEDITYDWASYAQNVKGLGVVGVGIQYLSYGSIDETDNSGAKTGDFSPNDLAVTLSYGRQLLGIDLGLNLKYISSKIEDTATAYAADLGGMYRMMDDRLTLGAAVQNVGTKMKFVNEEEDLPMNIKIGGAYAVRPEWLVALDVNAPIDNEPVYNAGTEYNYKINEAMSAAGRIGYNTRAKDTGGLNGISAGLGFDYMGYAIDYAFVPYGDLGNTHRISLGVKF